MANKFYELANGKKVISHPVDNKFAQCFVKFSEGPSNFWLFFIFAQICLHHETETP